MLEPERLARALADEMRFTASKDLLVLVSAVCHEEKTGGWTDGPHSNPEYLLGRDVEWRALVERALEVADA